MKKLFLNSESYWRPDFDSILITKEGSIAFLNQKSAFIFFNLIIRKTTDADFYLDKNVSQEELDDFISFMIKSGFATTQSVETENISPLYHY
ncbi:MAG: hypothetical protein GQ574_13775 [Crocinitomix sp.]|nr:hypothetical protein [Crocinitomix sp.]